MRPFVKRHFYAVTTTALSVICIMGMLIFKNLGELASLEFLYAYDAFFEFFRMAFMILWAYIALSLLFRMWKQYRQLKNDKTEAELALLKSKIDPHFFFNTLNNLYGLAIRKSDEAPDVILKLSEIMRYTIYEGENETVLLKDEVNYLEKYIEIHKIRYKKTVDIFFTKEIDDEHASVTPLLFIMLLENAFKHGVESLTNDAYIRVRLVVKNERITFDVENNFELKENTKVGMGVENLKRRLQLIYPKRHELLISKNTSVYKAKLIIELK